jgi:hypothetical protein
MIKKKVVLVYKDLEGNIAEESIWVNSTGEYYQIDNIPFYAPNLALNDIVSVEEDNGTLFFDKLIEPSGHSTIQILFFKEKEAKRVLKEIEQLNCKWEGMKDKPYYAIDIPFAIDYSTIKNLLDDELSKGTLDYKEACLSKNHIPPHSF